MKYLKLFFFLIFITCCLKYTYAQDIELVSGDISILKGQTTIMVAFVYDDMKVGEFNEEMYLKQKRTEFRKAPDADKFIAKWKADFKDKHEPKFIEQLNVGLKRIKLTATKDDTSKYTMIVTTTHIEPGFYGSAGGTNRDTYIDVTADIVESADHTNILATIKASNIIGIGTNTVEMKDSQIKITNAYGDCAYKITKLIVKLCKK